MSDDLPHTRGTLPLYFSAFESSRVWLVGVGAWTGDAGLSTLLTNPHRIPRRLYLYQVAVDFGRGAVGGEEVFEIECPRTDSVVVQMFMTLHGLRPIGYMIVYNPD